MNRIRPYTFPGDSGVRFMPGSARMRTDESMTRTTKRSTRLKDIEEYLLAKRQPVPMHELAAQHISQTSERLDRELTAEQREYLECLHVLTRAWADGVRVN